MTYEREVKRTAHRRASQILFRAWLFRIARNAVRGHDDSHHREEFHNRPTDSHKPATAFGFESPEWLAVLDSLERDAVTLRFIEQWERHDTGAVPGKPRSSEATI